MMDVLLLAGGPAGPELAPYATEAYKALLRIGGEYMVNIVLNSFRSAKLVKKIFVVGNVDIKDYINESLYDHFIAEGDSMLDNVLKGFEHKEIERDKKLMISACDIPFVTSDAIDNFIGFSLNTPFEAVYPVVEKKTYDAMFKDARRTWYQCKDGTFTGGNFISTSAAAVFKNIDMIKKIYENRKNPIKMTSIFGVKLLLKYEMGSMTKKDAEKAVYDATGMQCSGFVSNFAEIVFDIDKLSDYNVLLQCFKR